MYGGAKGTKATFPWYCQSLSGAWWSACASIARGWVRIGAPHDANSDLCRMLALSFGIARHHLEVIKLESFADGDWLVVRLSLTLESAFHVGL